MKSLIVKNLSNAYQLQFMITMVFVLFKKNYWINQLVYLLLIIKVILFEDFYIRIKWNIL